MTTAKHTPSWVVGDGSAQDLAQKASCWVLIATNPRPCSGHKIRLGAEAILEKVPVFAAAPDLLAACKALMLAEGMQSGKRDGGTMALISLAIDAARDAIAKAQGGAA